MANVGGLSGLKIVNNTLLVDEDTMSKNLIRLNSNSPIVRRNNNFFELRLDRISIDFDFTTGDLRVKPGYVESVVNETYIKNHIKSNYVKSIIDKAYIKDSIINELWYQDINIFNGEELLKKYSICRMKLNDLSMVVKNTNRSNNVTTISKIGNNKWKYTNFIK